MPSVTTPVQDPWPGLNIKTVFLHTHGKIRRSRDRLIFIMGIPIHLYIETAPDAWTDLYVS